MNGERLLERRRWFRVFPEGTLEFLVITRVLALFFLIALGIVGGTQRPLVLVALIATLWLDYAVMAWWGLQVAMDLKDFSDPTQAEDSPRKRAMIGLRVVLPSVAAATALMPWDGLLMLFAGSTASAGVSAGIPAVAGLAFLVLMVPAYRSMREVGFGSPLWSILFLIPLLHFFALHRIASDLDARIREQLVQKGEQPERTGSAAAALTAADITWVFSVLPWLVIIGIVVARGWPSGAAARLGPVCGTILAAFFAIANLAALENVQRRMVALIRKA